MKCVRNFVYDEVAESQNTCTVWLVERIEGSVNTCILSTWDA